MRLAPEPLGAQNALDGFDSGVRSLDDLLRRRAMRNQASGASRTFVARDDARVVGYYALAASAVAPDAATGRFRRNMPDPVPVAVLGRLAIDKRFQGRGPGRALFRDAALRVLAAGGSIGLRGMLVHAIPDEAKAFYVGLGLDVSPLEPMTSMATVADLKASLGSGSVNGA
ncbi:MAG: GNAT family N-acetyltransferase [Burkholderiales bacterium]|nr:GNAT family N-acetyltransferase [Burkholderiales bacterium]